MKRIVTWTLATAACATLSLACGGSSKTTKNGKNMTGQAAEAPPPPDVKEGGTKIKRDVSRAAEKEFAKAVKFHNAKAKAGWNRGSCEAAADRWKDVAGSYRKLVEARYNAGVAYSMCKMDKAAEGQYRAALKINPSHSQSLSNIGEIYFRGGNETRAKQYWNQAVKANPKIAGARNGLAWMLIRQIREGKGSRKVLEGQAEAHLQRVLAVETDNVEAYVLLALLYLEGAERNKSRLTLANLLLEKAEKSRADYAPLHNARGLYRMKRGNVSKALESFSRAIQLDAGFLEAHMNVGNITLDFRKYADAQRHFDAVLKKRPKDYDALIGLGIAQRGGKQIDAAEATYTKAKRLKPSRYEADYNLAVLFYDFRANATEDLDTALKHYRSAKKHYTMVLAKPNLPRKLKKEVDAGIKGCDKAIKNVQQAIQFRKSAPPPDPTPAPAPAQPPAKKAP